MRDALAIQQQASQRSELVIPSVDLAEDTRIAQERYTNGIQNIAIIGAGLLGSAVAADMSMCRVKVFVYDRNTASIDRLKATMERLCSPLVSQELLTREDLQTVMNNIVPCYTLEDAVSSADLVIEMVPEDLDLKRRVASDIERSGKPGVVIATSTLTLNLDAISQSLNQPGNCLGMRFLHPCLLIDPTEVTRASCTADATWYKVLGWLKSIYKHPFLGPTNRRLMGQECEALQLFASRERAARQRGIAESTLQIDFQAGAPSMQYRTNIKTWQDLLQERGLTEPSLLQAMKEATSTSCPDEYMCPITCEMMVDPVIASDGHTYERTAIKRWFQQKLTSPKTNLTLNSDLLVPNGVLRNQINTFIETEIEKLQTSRK